MNSHGNQFKYACTLSLDPETLVEIGNKLGKYVHLSEQTKQGTHTSYARIYLYMSISDTLP